jgi:cytoskeletal protein RodZ
MADICAATRIMASKIDALEHDRHDELPAPAYIRGYISAYAKALGLDPEPFLAEYERDIGGAASGVRLSEMPEMESVVPLGHQAHAVPKRIWIAAIAIVIAVSLVAWVARLLAGPSDEVLPVPPAETAPQSSPASVSPGASVPDTAAVVATPDASGAEAGVAGRPFAMRIAIAPGAASWLRVTVDGRLAYEGTLTSGSAKEWTVQREAVVRAGKPSAVTVTRDGVPVSFASAGGVGVATITVSP